MANKIKKILRISLVVVLIILCAILIFASFVNYHVKTVETYIFDQTNSITDGSFENFNDSVGDCCNTFLGKANVMATRQPNGIQDRFFLNLTSSNHCACINKPILNFTNSDYYLLSFYYRGDNPRMCNWVDGDNQCLPNQKLNSTNNWTFYKNILAFTNQSESASIYFYADSDGTKTVTNLYGDLEVHKLVPIENHSAHSYTDNESYVIKTRFDYGVNGNRLGDIDAKTGEAYFLVKGKPEVTIKFPWTEVVIVVIMMLIVIRLLFKKQTDEFVHIAEKDLGIVK